MNWDLVCRPKSYRGLEFQNTKDFNKAMLSKAVWELVLQIEKL